MVKVLFKITKKALHWYKKAAEQNYALGQYNLGLLYVKGQGASRNYVRAHMWWNIAASDGYSNGKKGRDIVEKKMTPEAINKAQSLARECVKKKYKDC
jgi:TPR repeat protein